MAVVRIVEFYAGVGGWHYAMERSGLNTLVVAAVDINTTANKVYKHNFPQTAHLQRNICGLTGTDLDSFSADVFTLSPPCQPFTRQGKRGDSDDHRTDSFFHLMQTLTEMKTPPRYIMMENVQGFESSKTRDRFLAILKGMGYSFQEFLLSPKQFGIPNSRLRYYLLAKKHPLSFATPLPEMPCQIIPNALEQFLSSDTCKSSADHNKVESQLVQTLAATGGFELPSSCTIPQTKSRTPLPIKCLEDGFIEPLLEHDLQEFLVPEKILKNYAMGLDIVDPSSNSSCCFTKGYFRYAVGTGSVLMHEGTRSSLDLAFKQYLDAHSKGEKDDSPKYLKETVSTVFHSTGSW